MDTAGFLSPSGEDRRVRFAAATDQLHAARQASSLELPLQQLQKDKEWGGGNFLQDYLNQQISTVIALLRMMKRIKFVL